MKRLFTLFALALSFVVSACIAQPTVPNKILIGFPAGSANDNIMRALNVTAKKPYVIDYTPGAVGTIAVEKAIHSSDYYGVVIGSGTYLFAIRQNKAIYNDIFKHYNAYIVAFIPYGIALGKSIPTYVKNFSDFVQYAKTHKLSYAVTDTRNQATMSMQEFSKTHGLLQTTPIPYKSVSQGLIDVIGGNVDFVFGDMVSLSAVKDKLRFVATTYKLANMNTPVFDDLGFSKKISVSGWTVLLVKKEYDTGKFPFNRNAVSYKAFLDTMHSKTSLLTSQQSETFIKEQMQIYESFQQH